jgi:hypothetical protein
MCDIGADVYESTGMIQLRGNALTQKDLMNNFIRTRICDEHAPVTKFVHASLLRVEGRRLRVEG